MATEVDFEWANQEQAWRQKLHSKLRSEGTNVYEAALRRIAELEAQLAGKWISDRLPKMPFQNQDGRYSQSVLVEREDGLMRVAFLRDGEWIDAETGSLCPSVKCWQNLPQPLPAPPPKENTDAE